MTRPTPDATHVTDGDVLRMLDGEPTVDADAAHAHVATCAACSARLAQYRRRAAALSALLAATAPAPVDAARLRPPNDLLDDVGRQGRRRWHARSGLRAAAAIAVLAAAAAASPARQWLRARFSAPTQVTLRAASSAAEPVAAPAGGARAVVRFAVDATPLRIRLNARQAAGALELAASDAARASAEVVDGAGDETLVVLPGELRVRNRPGSTATYRVTLPQGVRSVRVYVGAAAGGETVTLGAVGDTQIVPIAERPRGR